MVFDQNMMSLALPNAGFSRSDYGASWSIVVGLTLLTILPALLMVMTPLVRILVVFHFLRQALGTQTAPSNQILMGLALVMTWFLIQPVLRSINESAVIPYRSGSISVESALHVAVVPIKHYMLQYARHKDLELFIGMQGGPSPGRVDRLPITIVLPAYMLSELSVGFKIGVLLFIPFLLIDIVVASITTSIGMMQLPPVVISTPLKILLFVMVDGWNLLAGQLMKKLLVQKKRGRNAFRSSCRIDTSVAFGKFVIVVSSIDRGGTGECDNKFFSDYYWHPRANVNGGS